MPFRLYTSQWRGRRGEEEEEEEEEVEEEEEDPLYQVN